MGFIKVFIPLAILSILITGCQLETAKPSIKQHLLIASDCLNSNDQILFKKFEKQTGIDVKILYLSTDKLVNRLKNEGINTEIDCILLSSVVEMDRISHIKSLQKITTDSLPKILGNKNVSDNRDWYGLGYDPYVIITIGSTSKKIKDYSDLSQVDNWCTDLKNRKDLFPFYSYIIHKIQPTSIIPEQEWVKDFNAKKVAVLEEDDTLIYSNILFTKYSAFLKKRNNTLKVYRTGKIHFPNQRHGGVYFDMPCFGIVKQARNFTNAMTLMRSLYSNQINGEINRRLSSFPIRPDAALHGSYQTIRFKRYSRTPIRLTNTYSEVQNILY